MTDPEARAEWTALEDARRQRRSVLRRAAYGSFAGLGLFLLWGLILEGELSRTPTGVLHRYVLGVLSYLELSFESQPGEDHPTLSVRLAKARFAYTVLLTVPVAGLVLLTVRRERIRRRR